MPILFKVIQPDPPNIEPADPKELGGCDIALIQGSRSVTLNGDWGLVRNEDAGHQSVIREAGANTGALVYRPQWGMGLPGLQFKGATPQTAAKAETQVRRRLIANRRITKIINVSAAPNDNGNGIDVSLQCFVHGSRDPQNITIKPPRK